MKAIDDSKIRVPIVCKDCNGTGLYKGMAERGNSAVICRSCNGTGCKEIGFEIFVEKRIRDDVSRVYLPSPYVISNRDEYDAVQDRTIHFSKYGCSYDDWLKGAKPIPIKELMCPYECYNKGIGSEPLPICRKLCNGFGRISECLMHDEKSSCWDWYERSMEVEDE